MQARIPKLVAHRGDMQNYPENTLPAIEAALKAGACYVEFDVHLSKDEVPVVLHDANLRRTAGIDKLIFDLESTQFDNCSVHEESRLGSRFQGTVIPTLNQVMGLIQQWPNAKAFVEIKRKSLRHFGTQKVVDQIMSILSPYLHQCIVISFDADAVRYARAKGALSIGWVFEEWTDATHKIADELQPDFLFSDHTTAPKDKTRLWPGSWEWVLYDVMDAEQALTLAADGIHMIETGAIGEMLQHPQLQKERCNRN